MTNNQIHTDIAIIGGGIAGLMLQARLSNLGYSTLLLEQQALGFDQTSKAQGIIHGGIKYALLGQITKSARAIAEQPKTWTSYLTNKPINQLHDHLNLSKTKILATHHDLWNNGDLKNKLKQIIMSKAFSSHGTGLDPHDQDYPEIFKIAYEAGHFKGSVYKINETVIDVFSLLQNLSELNDNKIIKIDQDSLQINLETTDTNTINNNNHIASLGFSQNNNKHTIKAQQYIFTAGSNNQLVLDKLKDQIDLPSMQLRPLHMVLAKFSDPNKLFGHYTGSGILPELTITTHHTKDNNYVWYLGGSVAESGINLDQQQQITKAKKLINKVFPWLNTNHWQWQSFMVNRAEPLQAKNSRPEHSYYASINNIIIGWPVKMALAPMLCDKISEYLKEIKFTSKYKQLNTGELNLTKPSIAQPIWDLLFSK